MAPPSWPSAPKAKNKARLAKFIDWMYSPEGIYASSSNSGGAACPKDLGCFTTDKDGKNPTLTKFGQQAMTGDHANLKVSAKLGGSSYDDGYSKLNFKAVSQNDIDPNTGEAYNPLLWKSNQDETELFKDWSAHMENATNDIDYLQKAGKLSIAAGASYTTPQEDSTVSATRSSVKSETVNASWQAITAAGKFEKTLDEARTKIDNLGYKEVLKVDQQNAKDLIQARKGHRQAGQVIPGVPAGRFRFGRNASPNHITNKGRRTLRTGPTPRNSSGSAYSDGRRRLLLACRNFSAFSMSTFLHAFVRSAFDDESPHRRIAMKRKKNA